MTLATLPSISISNDDFQTMLNFAKAIYRLEKNKMYIQKINNNIHDIAKYHPNYPSVLMGIDFHLSKNGPKLIEINNNAGGLWSWKTKQWLQQPIDAKLKSDVRQRIAVMFPSNWQQIAILDDNITQQFFYPEMHAYAKILSDKGAQVYLVSPEDIKQRDNGCLYINGTKLDGIYNRHTDFYFSSDDMKHIKDAYSYRTIEISPHPSSYALVADKSRMVDWWKPHFLQDVLPQTQDILNVVPKINKLAEMDAEEVWKKRKQYVFKPTSSHGGKGVLIGKTVRKKRFQAMLEQADDMVVQEFVPAPLITLGDETFKYDVRLYMCGESLIGLAARLFKGSVTNFTHPDAGFYPVKVI